MKLEYRCLVSFNTFLRYHPPPGAFFRLLLPLCFSSRFIHPERTADILTYLTEVEDFSPSFLLFRPARPARDSTCLSRFRAPPYRDRRTLAKQEERKKAG